jgi:hypothetical protein
MKFTFPILFGAILLLSACGSSYNTQFPPPTGEEKYSEIVPAEIGGEAVRSEKLEREAGVYHGSRFAFGEKASIVMVQCSNQKAIDTYFKGTVVPQLEEGFGSKVSGKFNGVWSARASGSSGRIQAWQNDAYVFVIEAGTDELFEEIVEKFPYIAKK